MRKLLYLGLIACLPVVFGDVPLPDTAVAKEAAAHIQAFNSGDKGKLIEFFNTHFSDSALKEMGAEPRADRDLRIHSAIGDFEIRQVTASQGHHIELLLQAKKGNWLRYECTVTDDAPHKIAKVIVDSGQPPASGSQTPQAAPPATDGAKRPDEPPSRTDFKAPSVTVPMLRVNNRPAVEGSINGSGKWKLAIEWGGSISGVSQHVADELKLPIIGEVKLSPTRTVKIAKVDSISVGGVTWHDLAVLVGAAQDLSVDAFLGINICGESLATLDYPTSQVRFEQGSLPAPNGRDVLAIAGQDRGGRPDIEVEIGGQKVAAVLDTRGQGWFAVGEALMSKMGLFPDAGKFSANGPSIGRQEIQERRLNGKVLIGGFVIDQPLIDFRPYPNAIIGYNVLEKFAITLDSKNKRVRFARTSTAPIKPSKQEWETAK